MNRIELENFKCFAQHFEFPLNRKNLLLYGENGSGKSSLTAAFRLIFYREKLFAASVSDNMSEAERSNVISDILDKYRFQGRKNQPFSLIVNEMTYDSFPVQDYQVSILTRDDVNIIDSIHLLEIFRRAYLPISDINTFLGTHVEQIEQEVNKLLHDYFMENLQITIERGNDYTCSLSDDSRKLAIDQSLPYYFNEAKLHMTTILLLLLAVKYIPTTTERRLLLLDDLLTSMDTSNRTFFMRFIVETFSSHQILFFTHNINFYHTARYLVHEAIPAEKEKWICTHLYEFSFGHRLLNDEEAQKNISKFKSDLDAPHVNLEDMGNRIRKRFEYAIYEFSQLLLLGAIEEPDKVLARICSRKACYLKGKNDASDLVDEIQTTLNADNQMNVIERIKTKIEQYRIDMPSIHAILNTMKLYQKASLHPLSHANVQGVHAPSQKELKQTLFLLEQLQNAINKLKDKRIEC